VTDKNQGWWGRYILEKSLYTRARDLKYSLPHAAQQSWMTSGSSLGQPTVSGVPEIPSDINFVADPSGDTRQLRRLYIRHIILSRQEAKARDAEGAYHNGNWYYKSRSLPSMRCGACFKWMNSTEELFKTTQSYATLVTRQPFFSCNDCRGVKGKYSSKPDPKRKMIFTDIEAIFKFDLRPSELGKYPMFLESPEQKYYLIENDIHINQYDWYRIAW